ncbi:MAG TPA: MarR family transcriptional regulator [Pyrinomonadaceae bacterium]|jgi:DNA-binding MarR family transcriptional regulator|nr:MarR family transcriptional regulator [Pyrinomonadaceae bacterium]
MSSRVDSEAKQKRSFESVHEEVFLHIQRTAEALMWGVMEALKPAGLTPTQYNVLRILRGAGKEGLACREIAERMVNRDPDITRLLDRLEGQKLVKRSREKKDRRVVMTYITAEGLRLLKELDGPMTELHERQLGHLKEQHLRNLTALLETARKRVS